MVVVCMFPNWKIWYDRISSERDQSTTCIVADVLTERVWVLAIHLIIIHNYELKCELSLFASRTMAEMPFCKLVLWFRWILPYLHMCPWAYLLMQLLTLFLNFWMCMIMHKLRLSSVTWEKKNNKQKFVVPLLCSYSERVLPISFIYLFCKLFSTGMGVSQTHNCSAIIWVPRQGLQASRGRRQLHYLWSQQGRYWHFCTRDRLYLQSSWCLECLLCYMFEHVFSQPLAPKNKSCHLLLILTLLITVQILGSTVSQSRKRTPKKSPNTAERIIQ